MVRSWLKLPCTATKLRLDLVLAAGQSFRWKQNEVTKIWSGVIGGKVWNLKQDGDDISYFVHEVEKKAMPCPHILEQDNSSVLVDYFQLDVDVEELFQQWCEADKHFASVSETFRGMRTLRLDPVENTFSFICSSNNNIPRITALVNSLCRMYGEKLETAEEEEREFYTFPSVHALASDNVEQELKDAGFGYRAKFISQSAKMIVERHKGDAHRWLSTLRDVPYQEARAGDQISLWASELSQSTGPSCALMEFPGIGPKVADCICLLSLDKTEAIPVDTHVWQITKTNYMPNLLNSKSLTDKVYKQIGDYYRKLFGKYAGWAHSVLFAADLKNFQHRNSNVKSSLKNERDAKMETETQPKRKRKGKLKDIEKKERRITTKKVPNKKQKK